MALIYNELSDIVLMAAGSVHRSVGSGLLESVYQEAFGVELKFLGVPFKAQHPFKVYHRKQLVGEYFADIVVDNKIILELKAVNSFSPSMEAQLLNYLSISGIKVGYLFNFKGATLKWQRMVL
jgi:GxxExxY protein